MVDSHEVPLQRLYMLQAIELFQSAYAPYVLNHLRVHFAERLNSYLRSLAKREKSSIFVDFVDGQPQPDFLALIHLMTHDGGLRTGYQGYTPVIFNPNGTHADALPVMVPAIKELRLIRLRRNALNHQKPLSGEMMIDTIVRMQHMVAALPERYQSNEIRLQFQLLLARSQSLEYAQQLDAIHRDHQQRIDAERHQSIVQQQQRHTQQLQSIKQHIDAYQHDVLQAQQHITALQQQLTQLLHDQQLIASGTAEAVVDGRRAMEERITRLQQLIDELSLPRQSDAAFDKFQRELATQQQIAADMRSELNRLHEQVDALKNVPAPSTPPVSPQSSRGVNWVVIVIGIVWLWYSGWWLWAVERIQPYIGDLIERIQMLIS